MRVVENEQLNERQQQPRGGILTAVGVVLVLLSGVCFFTMLAVPLMSLTNAQKGMLGGALFIGVQACWWIGVALMGPAAIKKVKAIFDRQTSPDQDDRLEM